MRRSSIGIGSVLRLIRFPNIRRKALLAPREIFLARCRALAHHSMNH
jgi:hypothetical protein